MMPRLSCSWQLSDCKASIPPRQRTMCSGQKRLENRVESVYREALADLFRGPKTMKDVMKILKVREIYRHLSNAADMEDQAANVVADIIMKLT
jgi:uncharacterized protein Yka (UPF0111/DUF47 family)